MRGIRREDEVGIARELADAFRSGKFTYVIAKLREFSFEDDPLLSFNLLAEMMTFMDQDDRDAFIRKLVYYRAGRQVP